LLIPPDRQKHGSKEDTPPPPPDSLAARMRNKLRTDAAASAFYRMRKAIVEPVFGQIKGA
jgi:hypothetical protein